MVFGKLRLAGLLASVLFVGGSQYKHITFPTSRKLLKYDKSSNDLVLYEFEDLQGDGYVEVCVAGPQDRNGKTCYYLSREHAEFLRSINGGKYVGRAGYTKNPSKEGDKIKMLEVIIMDADKQQEINSLNASAKDM